MAEAYSDKALAPGLSFGGIRTYIWAGGYSSTDTTYTIQFGGSAQSIACSQYGFWFEIEANGSRYSETSASTSNGTTGSGAYWKTEASLGTCYATFDRRQYDYSVNVIAYAQFNSNGSRNCSAVVSITIPARTRTAHGNPSFSSSQKGTLQGQKTKLTWAKSGTQGNANFDHFELWQGSTKLYSGSATAMEVTPSSYKASGDVSFTLKEVHEWYGSYPETSSSVTVHVLAAMGKPTLSVSKSTANYAEEVTLSWKPSSSAAALDRYEVHQGASTLLWDGKDTSTKVTPSDATGAKGGTVTYTLTEYREWYGNIAQASATVKVTVRSGVCTYYDTGGKAHTVLVTYYDTGGKGHFVTITYYDASGKPHSVV